MLLNVSFHLFAHMYAKGLDWVIYKDAFPLLHVSDSVQSKVIVLNETAIIGKWNSLYMWQAVSVLK